MLYTRTLIFFVFSSIHLSRRSFSAAAWTSFIFLTSISFLKIEQCISRLHVQEPFLMCFTFIDVGYTGITRTSGLPGGFRFFWGGGGGSGTFGGKHSVEDHYLHKNWIIFGRGVANFWEETPAPKTGQQEALDLTTTISSLALYFLKFETTFNNL